jgi:16S rRNA (cytidine1402-2'-O)-methyltransferase
MSTAAPGTLFVVSTPIGNLEDITLRALRILKEVDLIAAEDTRRTRILLSAHGITASMTSYHDYNKKSQGKKLLAKLLSGQSVALVSDAGTPGISDPGYFLINLAIQKEVAVIPVPGASAMIAALSISGLPTERFSFEGFLPKKANSRKKHILQLKDKEETLIFYESPYRIGATLQDLRDILGNRRVVVARELTKRYEEIVRGPLAQVIEELSEKKMKGEFTILVSSARYAEKVLYSRKE